VAHVLDQERLGETIDRLYRAAWALCGSRHDAEDLVQETYARVLAKPRLIRRDTDLAYLLRVLRNTFVTQRERQMRSIPVPEEALAGRANPRADAQPQVAAETADLFATIASLSSSHRDVIVAVDVVGLSYGEAARALRIPKGTVMSRLYRARERIAAELAPEGTGDEAVPSTGSGRSAPEPGASAWTQISKARG
jgi:RNA polymerase sigma-70 factor (ECF subfamily)